jgi:uncharacterized protein (UPF0262 family)
MSQTEYIRDISLDEGTVIRRVQHVEEERAAAMRDLLHENYFAPVGLNAGPYDVSLGTSENRLLFFITADSLDERQEVTLAVAPFRSIIREYFMICESYFEAIKSSDPFKVEAIDMGRRAVHNEGSELMKKLLEDRIALDFDTARRLFTLMCVLHIK